jgi:hypothetical protein
VEKTDDFRQRALAADLMAARTPATILRQGFHDLAKQWRALADQVEARAKPKG